MAKEASAPDFDALLDTEVATVERPPPMPVGTFRTTSTAYRDVGPSREGNKGVEVTFKGFDPQDDVDEQEWAEYTEKVDAVKLSRTYTFWMTENAAYRLREFLDKLGIDHTGRTFRQVLPEIVGCSVLVYVNQEPSQKKGDDRVFSNITGFTTESDEDE